MDNKSKAQFQQFEINEKEEKAKERRKEKYIHKKIDKVLDKMRIKYPGNQFEEGADAMVGVIKKKIKEIQ